MSMANVCYKDALNEVRCGGIGRDELIAFLRSLDLYDDDTILYTIRRLVDDGKIFNRHADKIFYEPTGTINDWLKNG